jgi:hypothetical protein
MRSTVIRTHLLGFIWIAAAIDIWCCQFLTPADELNPLARWLLVQHGVWGLVSAKVVGTWIVTEWLRHLHIGYSVAVASVMLATLLVLGGIIPV